MWITRISIDQPVFATMIMLGIVVLGVFCYRLMPVEQMPEIDAPQVYITVGYPGASPEAIENDVVKPIENVINSVNGVKNIYATAREGIALMSAEFRLDVDITATAQEVRDKVAQIQAGMPREVQEPRITRASNDSSLQPVVSLVVYSTIRSVSEVTTIVDQQIVKRLESVYGVDHVSVGGGVKRQVYLYPDQLQNFHIGCALWSLLGLGAE